MASFRDKDGRDWAVAIVFGDVRRLKAAGCDLGSKDLGLDPINDPDRFARVLWVLLGRQAEARGLTEDALADAFDGAAMEGFLGAFMEAHADFSLTRDAAAEARKLIPGRMRSLAAAQIRLLNSTSSATAGDSPGLPESIPAS